MRQYARVIAIAAIGLLGAAGASAHCQIPCGIYDDPLRFGLLEEHIATIEKSMNQINELSADPAKNANQLARWVMNKEDHAKHFADIVVEYFLQQRVKPVAPEQEHEYEHYLEQVTQCHQMLVTVMKAKQTTDLEHCATLRALVADFKKAYLHES
ncbi:MAG TPA: superoxide dismutase [Ni] [Candidatus Hydrogenedentes bacterium]|nr:superoxide dismutase [Ni] [Candidatus Hydrogenedentota bacterium]HPG69503.1 superoxide dismutase [Ni] [Candidatus Hydrogenedentota bacterium]